MRSPGTRLSASTISDWPLPDDRGSRDVEERNASMARRALHSVAKPMAVLITSTAAISARLQIIAERDRDGRRHGEQEHDDARS